MTEGDTKDHHGENATRSATVTVRSLPTKAFATSCRNAQRSATR